MMVPTVPTVPTVLMVVALMAKQDLPFLIFLAVMGGVLLAMCTNIEKVPDVRDRDVIVLPDSTNLMMMLCGMRDDSTHVTSRDGIWHGFIEGDTDPTWWGFVSRQNHVLIMNQMSGTPPIMLSDTTRVVIVIVNTKGTP